ncbi:unnamed protein product [Bursaphelenchus xylophilus]|uniref:(pine wood nematode) hypothetical protein n=1 Tax=Bursaphelenchus xylophilus TaxID=6326 RepID=A0A1I7SD26_BURXY|nr:unnamed protein product [Bursaphelenchus xylophilus]CAG9093051.1 unnamed protein product [Bursaphelenchus xylophilus]
MSMQIPKDQNLNIGRRKAMTEPRKPFRFLLVLCAATQFVGFLLAVKLLYNQTGDVSIFKKFQVATLMFMVIFQIITTIIAFFATINLFEMAWKGSYGTGEDRTTKIMCYLGFIACCIFLSAGGYLRWRHAENFRYHGVFFWLIGTTCFLYAIVWFRRFRLTNQFVSDALHANGLNCIPLTEQNARDLYQIRDYDMEVHTYIHSSAWMGYRRHYCAVRHSEYYAIQKWIAQLERLVHLDDNKESLNCLIREMIDRCHQFKIPEDTEFRYKQLAQMPLIFVPVDECSCNHDDEDNES